MSQSRQLAAIMFTDIVGYTALMGSDEEKAFELLKKNRELQKPLIEQNNGKWIKELGDGVLASFTTVTDAVQCSISIQQSCNNIPGLELRIGIHLGDVIFENGDVFGDGVNIASRLQAIAPIGGIYISESVHNNIANKKGIETRFVRAETLKNVKEPVRIYEVSSDLANPVHYLKKRNNIPSQKRKKIIFGTGTFLLLLLLAYFFVYKKINISNDKKAIENSIAVLYFDNMSGDSTQEYFSDGMTEEIISRLSGIHGLKVKSRTSVLQYKNQRKNTKQIATELGLNNILTGSVRKQGNMVRIIAQLINAETDENIWSEQYDKEMKDIFAVQSEIALEIAKKFQIKLSDATEKRLVTPPTLNTEAYDLYLKASTYLTIRDDFGLGGKQLFTQKAISCLKQAIKLDPSFADAYALLSEYYVSFSAVAPDPKHWLDSATILARKAIELSPDREAGFTALANVKHWQGLYDESLKWLIKAHEIAPFSTAAKIVDTYQRKNEYGKAYEWVMKAMEYDPADLSYHSSEAGIYYTLGLNDSMKNCIDRARRVKIESSDIDGVALSYYWHTGNYEEWARLAKKIYSFDEKTLALVMGVFYLRQRDWRIADSLYTVSSKPDDMDAGLVKIQVGKKEQGRLFLKKAIQTRIPFLGLGDVWHHYDISRCYAALQDKRYIIYFNNALEKGWHFYAFFQDDPFFDFVRETPEFKKLWQKIYERNEGFKADLFAAIKRHANS